MTDDIITGEIIKVGPDDLDSPTQSVTIAWDFPGPPSVWKAYPSSFPADQLRQIAKILGVT